MNPWMWPLAFLIVFEILADVFAQEYALKPHAARWSLAIAAYIIANSFWLEAMKRGVGLGKGAILFNVSTGIIAVLIGMFYKEQITLQHWIGIGLGLVSTYLLVN